MKDAKLNEVLQGMQSILDNAQLEQLKRILQHTFWNCTVTETETADESEVQNSRMIELFLSSKRVEGCSEKTLRYYKTTIEIALNAISKDILDYTCNF